MTDLIYNVAFYVRAFPVPVAAVGVVGAVLAAVGFTGIWRKP